MGSSDQERRAVTVPDGTWRKAKVLAAAFGLPISTIVAQAIEEMADNHKEQILMMMGGDK